jgi:multiple sugar transport system substrate-binding protein
VYPRRRRVRRTRLGAPAFVAALLCLLTSCTSGGPPAATPSPSPSPSASAGPVTLRFAVYGGVPDVMAYRAMARVYTRSRPDVTVKVEAMPDEVTADAKLDREFAAGRAPDVFLTGSTALPSLVSQNRVQPVDVLLEKRGVEFGDNYERLGLEAFAADDALQCMPSDVSPYVVFYNKRLFAGVTLAEPGQEPPTPQTGWAWDQFVRAAQQMSHRGVKGVYLAPDLTTLTPLLRSAGTDIVDDPQKPTTLQLADGPTRSALEQVLTVARSQRLTPTPQQLAKSDAVSRFESGRLGMLIGTRALVPELRAHPGLRFDVLPLPNLGRSRTIAEVSGYCISHDSRHIDDAADFLAFASGRRAATLTARSGGIVPANLDALHAASFVHPAQPPLASEVFVNVMRRADTMPNPPAWPRVVSATQPLLNRLFYAPVLDLDTLLPRIDAVSAGLLEQPTPSASPSASASASGSASP